MTLAEEIPPEIGPHDGRELALMLAGKKPLAMFSDVVGSTYPWPDAAFAPHVAAGALVMREFLSTTRNGGQRLRHLYYALPQEEWRIARAHALCLKSYDAYCREAEEDCIELGRLLGYSEREIQCFVERSRYVRSAMGQQPSSM